MVDICITLQNAEKITKDREKGVSSRKRSSENRSSQELPILFFMIFAGVAVHVNVVSIKMEDSRQTVDPSAIFFSKHFGESLRTKSHIHI